MIDTCRRGCPSSPSRFEDTGVADEPLEACLALGEDSMSCTFTTLAHVLFCMTMSRLAPAPLPAAVGEATLTALLPPLPAEVADAAAAVGDAAADSATAPSLDVCPPRATAAVGRGKDSDSSGAAAPSQTDVVADANGSAAREGTATGAAAALVAAAAAGV